MAFPTVAETATTNGTSATTTPSVTVPVAGATDLTIVQIRVAVAGTIGWPGGWTEIAETSADASDDVTAWGYLYGATNSPISLSSGNGKFSAVAYRITGAQDPAVQVPELSSIVTGTSTAPNPPDLTPTGGAKDYLWIAAMGCEGEQTSPVTYPSSYTDGITANSGTAGVVTTNTRSAFAARQLNTATEGALAFTISASDDWTAVMIAVHPETSSGPITVTPGVIALVSAAFAPTISVSNNQSVVPGVVALVLTSFAPTVTATANQTVVPGLATLTLTTFAPTITATDHQTVTPGVAALSLASFAPTIGIGVSVVPNTASLALTTFAPTVAVSDHQTVTPTTASLSLATFAPTVTGGAGVTVTPPTASLILTAFAPTTVLTDHKLVTPDVAALTLTTFAPNVQAGAGLTVVPGTASLAMTAFAPTVVLTDHKLVTPDLVALTLATFAPDVSATAHQTVTPPTASLLLATFNPTVLAGGMALADDLIASFVMASRPTAGIVSVGRSEATVGD